MNEEQEIATEVAEEVNPETSPDEPQTSKELETALAQKTHWRQKAEKAEAERVALEAKLNANASNAKSVLEVEDFIDISTSLEGLDQKEKEFLAREHKLSGRPLNEIRKDEDFLLWQSAYQQKVEKEKLALKPSGTQSESDRPTSLAEKLKSSSIAEKEKMLTELGLYKQPRPRLDRTNIGAN